MTEAKTSSPNTWTAGQGEIANRSESSVPVTLRSKTTAAAKMGR
jgi:hypothetical protein